MEAKELNFLIGRINQLRRWQFVNHLKDEESIHLGQLPLLEYVNRNPGCSQKELAERFCLSRACVTKSVKRMLKSDLVRRDINEEDIRQFCLYITEKGAALSQRCRQAIDEVDALAFAGFSEEEFEIISQFTQRMANNLETDYSRGKPAHVIKREIDRIEEGEE